MKSSSTRTARPRMATFRTIVALVGATLFLGVAPASAAFAATSAEQTTVATAAETVRAQPSTFVGPIATKVDDGGVEGGTQGSDSRLIAINRWANATGTLHTKTNPLDPAGQIASSSRVGTQSLGLTAVTGLWSGTAALSDFAANLTPIQAAGIQVDRGAAALGTVIIQNPLIFVIAGMIAIIGAVWNKSRGRDGTGMFKQVIAVALVFTTVGVMSLGASESTPKLGDTTSKYVPGVGSPGWLITILTNTVGAAADGALAGVSNVDLTTTLNTEDKGKAGQLSCGLYTTAMNSDFNSMKKSGTASMSSISKMWQTAGASVWANVQFGVDNAYRDKVWCHQADHTAGIRPSEQMILSTAGVNGAAELQRTANLKSKAWSTTNNLDEDKTMIAWAACNWDGSNWQVEPAFNFIDASSCKAWWAGDQGTDLDFGGKGFNIGTGEPGPKQIHELTEDEGVLNFMRAWQGTESGVGGSILIVWAMISALIMFLILGVVLSGAVVVAKILAIVTMATLILILVGSLFTKAGPGPKIVALLKKVFGYTLLAAGSSAIVMLVTWLTQTMMALGNSLFSAPGSVVGLIWTGASPILALIALHMLFKSFKLPSPITAKGALAWGAAGGAAGSIIGGGIASRMAGRAGDKAVGSAKRAGSAAVSKLTGGKVGQPYGIGGKSRDAAGLPPVAGGDKSKSSKKPGSTPDRKELAEARAHARSNGESVPQSATERANARLHGAASKIPTAGKVGTTALGALGGTLNAGSKAKNAATAIIDGRAVDGAKIFAGRVDEKLTKAANIDLGEVALAGGRRVGSAVKAGDDFLMKKAGAVVAGAAGAIGTGKMVLAQSRTKEGRATLSNAAGVARKRRAEARTEKAKTSPLAKQAAVISSSVNTTLKQKAKLFGENPTANMWAARKPAGTLALHGIAAVATGGISLAPSAVVLGMNNAKKARTRRTDANNALIEQLRNHKQSQVDQNAKASDNVRNDGAGAPVVTPKAPSPTAPVPGSMGTN